MDSEVALTDTNHRVRQLKDEPHSQKDAEAAVGLGTDNGKRLPVQMDEDIDELAPEIAAS